jgi:flagellar hook-associated protein 2
MGATTAYDLKIRATARTTTIEGAFSSREKGVGGILERKITTLIDPFTGAITVNNKALESQNTTFSNRITDLDKRLASKRTRLETQFASMEKILSGLQSQQTSLNSLSNISYSSK